MGTFQRQLQRITGRLLRLVDTVFSVPFQCWWCFSQGMRRRADWQLYGRPMFRQLHGGEIIGKRFVARSRSRGNSIGVFQPVILTVGKGGLLEIRTTWE